jgi:hypothetical protein
VPKIESNEVMCHTRSCSKCEICRCLLVAKELHRDADFRLTFGRNSFAIREGHSIAHTMSKSQHRIRKHFPPFVQNLHQVAIRTLVLIGHGCRDAKAKSNRQRSGLDLVARQITPWSLKAHGLCSVRTHDRGSARGQFALSRQREEGNVPNVTAAESPTETTSSRYSLQST